MKRILLACIALTAASVIAVSAPPLNDNFADRETIAGPSGSVSGSNIDASLESDETHFGNTKTVWWTWTPPKYAYYQVDTFGSSFDTYLTAFVGDTLSSLYVMTSNNDALGTQQSAVCVEAGPGTTYQIQVSGDNAGDVGTITLNWHAISNWSDWIFSHYYTDSFFRVEFGNDLSVLSFKYMQVWESWYRTNELGCEDKKYKSLDTYTNGFTITDKYNNKRIDDKLPGGIDPNFSVQCYDGKHIIVYDHVNKKLVAYKTGNGEFIKSAESAIDNFSSAWFDGSDIIVFLTYANSEGIKVFDKNLMKEKWTDTPGAGDIVALGNGLVVRRVQSNNVLNITCRKNGKKVVSQHTITNPVDASLYVESDSKGGILYWTNKANTNSPLTYVDRKGETILNNQSMAEVGNVWYFNCFDGKSLYVRKPLDGGSNTFYVYKVKGLKNLGMKDVGGWARLEADGKAYFLTANGSESSVIVCDKKLKKEKWSSPPADGDVARLSKEVFVRKVSSTIVDVIRETYTLFNKKGEIVTYEFSYPK